MFVVRVRSRAKPHERSGNFSQGVRAQEHRTCAAEPRGLQDDTRLLRHFRIYAKLPTRKESMQRSRRCGVVPFQRQHEEQTYIAFEIFLPPDSSKESAPAKFTPQRSTIRGTGLAARQRAAEHGWLTIYPTRPAA